ncbi:MAG: pilus assembly protein PilM [Candidatus Omnitrophica bacterium]|nr:pilus assembly protein PilM [Candidatus Omnitrophota bacterium]
MVNGLIANLTSIFQKKPKVVVSIEFGQAFLKISFLEPYRNRFKLKDLLIEKISLTNQTKDDLIALIKSFLERNSILEAQVCLTISDPDSIVIKNLELPVLPKAEIIGAAKWQLKDELNFDLKDATIEWQVIREFTDQEQVKKNEIVFAVANAEAVNEYISVLKECNITPSKVSLAPFNYSNILKSQPESFKVESILDIGYNQSSLYIYLNNTLKFSRKIPFSSEKLTQDLTGTLISDKGKVQLSYAEAEEIKQTFGFPKSQNQAIKGNIEAIQVISLMRPHLEILAKELKRSFDYFVSELDQEISSKLYLVGGGANLKNLDSYLAKELSLEVLSLPFLENFDFGEIGQDKLDNSRLQLLNNLGAVLFSATAINLLPKEIKAQKSELIQTVSLRVSAITIAALFFFAVLILKSQEASYKVRIFNAKAHLETISEVRTLRQGILAREALVNQLQIGKVPADGLLKLLSVLVPDEVILDQVSFNQERSNLTLRGHVLASGELSETVLSKFMQRLESSAFFIEAGLTSSKKEGSIQKFELACELAD